MSRTDCISNRNISIVSSYLLKKRGSYSSLFHDLPFPSDRYESPEAFFLNEDEWTTFENFQKILRRAKDLSEEPYFYFNCGSSSAMLKSWGRFGYLVRFFHGPDDGFKELSFFNRNINDTKDIEVIIPPSYDKTLKRVRLILKVSYHDDIDVNNDYIMDAYRRGLISSIPTLWGLYPAKIKQPLNAYDPVILLNNEPEFAEFGLNAKIESGYLTITDPIEKVKKRVGKSISLASDRVNEKEIFLGRYSEQGRGGDTAKKPGAILITETVHGDDRILLRKGEIYNAPYFILDVTYNRFSWIKRCIKVLKKKRNKSANEELRM